MGSIHTSWRRASRGATRERWAPAGKACVCRAQRVLIPWWHGTPGDLYLALKSVSLLSVNEVKSMNFWPLLSK